MHIERDIPLATRQALQHASNLIFDVDGTLAERQRSITPSLAQTLQTTGRTLGIATSRALDELDEVFQGTGFSRQTLMTGPVIIEDGSAMVLPGQESPTLMVSPEQAVAVHTLIAHVKRHMSIEPLDDKWHRLGDIEFPLVHIPSYYAYQASGSIWQQVIGKPRDLEKTMDWCQAAAEALQVRDLVQLTEIGDGTLRISVPGRSKGAALVELHNEGILNLAETVYFGDGRNDVPAAREIRKHGGFVVAVDRHCAELVACADHVCSGTGPQALQQLLITSGVARRF